MAMVAAAPVWTSPALGTVMPARQAAATSTSSLPTEEVPMVWGRPGRAAMTAADQGSAGQVGTHPRPSPGDHVGSREHCLRRIAPEVVVARDACRHGVGQTTPDKNRGLSRPGPDCQVDGALTTN